MEGEFEHRDEIGPARMLCLSSPDADLRAFLVLDNTAAGPAIGGVRLALNGSVGECARLARAMTLKCALAGLPHGGGKSVILADPSATIVEKERLVRAFARAIAAETDYIPGPDMGLDERAMAWVHDEIGRAVGLPRDLGGLALDELGATGFGLAIAAEAVESLGGPKLKGARIVVQGFGAVGANVARFLAQRGAVLVAASDSRGAIANADGLDIAALIRRKISGDGLAGAPGSSPITHGDLIGVDCELWIPAARPDTLNADNVGRLRAKVMLQGANIRATAEAERMMEDAGVLSVPDIIANAGAVIGAAVEYAGGAETEAFADIEKRIRGNTTAVLIRAAETGESPRAAATEIAVERVRKAMAELPL